MQLYFRLIGLLIKLLFVKKQGIHEPVSVDFRVLPNDLDLNMHMNNSRYLALMDLGRVAYMGYTGVLRKTIKNKWSPIVSEIDIKYKKSLDPWMKFQLVNELIKYDEKYFYIKQTFVYKEKVMAEAKIKGLFISPKGKVPPHVIIESVED